MVLNKTPDLIPCGEESRKDILSNLYSWKEPNAIFPCKNRMPRGVNALNVQLGVFGLQQLKLVTYGPAAWSNA